MATVLAIAVTVVCVAVGRGARALARGVVVGVAVEVKIILYNRLRSLELAVAALVAFAEVVVVELVIAVGSYITTAEAAVVAVGLVVARANGGTSRVHSIEPQALSKSTFQAPKPERLKLSTRKPSTLPSGSCCKNRIVPGSSNSRLTFRHLDVSIAMTDGKS